MKLAPENRTMPTSSPSSCEIMSDISSLARPRRVGFMSWASILRETSKATITCTPRCSTISMSLPHWGRAKAKMMRVSPENHKTNRRSRILRLAATLSRSMRAGSPMRRTDAARRAKAHPTSAISTGSAARAYKNSGAPKLISTYGILLNTVWDSVNSSSSSSNAGTRNHTAAS